jgi:hypothetical protein
VKYLRERGAYVVKNWGGPHSRVGLPDLFVCYRGHFIGLELKNPTLHPLSLMGTPAQEQELASIRHAGGFAEVVNSLDAIARILNVCS